MAGPGDVFERSMNINAKFLPRLQAAVEQNALLRIGWTGSGEKVPKNGEVGLCPAMPEGARKGHLENSVLGQVLSEMVVPLTLKAMLVHFLAHTTTTVNFQQRVMLDVVLDL